MTDEASWSGPERRRRPRAERHAADLLTPGAFPATVTELVRWTGFSRATIMADIAAGELKPVDRTVVAGSKYLVPAAETVRYLRQLGILVVPGDARQQPPDAKAV